MAVSVGASRRSQRGVALVVTLIMLAVITFMAVTFLVLSQRERSAVNGSTDSKIARSASDTALARVCTELLTRMMLQSNFQDFSLIVSTNYINYAGLHGGVTTPLSPTNVNYDYLDAPGHPAVTLAQDRNIAIASLEFNPRAPVYVVTNTGTGQGESRHYYDANRNGRDDVNGNWPVIVADSTLGLRYESTNSAGQLITVATNFNGWVLTNTMVGDPEWIGVLERPQELHSADNRFIGRYAYYVVPIGKALDLNTVHNQSITKTVPNGTDGYLRNQGVGPWEINLAGFLADLNTNIWDANPNLNPNPYYQYREGLPPINPNRGPNLGFAFDDARALISYRYANNYNALFSANSNFAAARFLLQNSIDFYSDGPVMLTTSTNENVIADVPTQPWLGSDNPNHFFSPQDMFDPTKTSAGFVGRLQQAGTSNDTYNAYTYYRLLAQLGSESAADQGKININFKNTDDAGNVIPGLETNLNSWTALDFFTNAANAMFRQMDLRDWKNDLVTITNIPIYENPLIYTNINYYTPAVHRVLQLAANMFDTMTNRFINGGSTNYPTVFRPIFNSANGIVSIVGYQEVIDDNPALNFEYWDAAKAAANPGQLAGINIFGVPWVIGAKKGFPNFNEFTMDNPLTVSRDLEFTNAIASRPWTTNQIFNLSITNTFGLEAWNSYTNIYGRALQLVASNQLTIIITNENNTSLLQVTNLAFGINTNWNTGWPGWGQGLSDKSFMVPLFVSNNYTNGIYRRDGTFIPINPPSWDATFRPHLWMSLQFKLQFILIDTSVSPHRVIDFVNLITTQPTIDIPAMLDNTADGFEVVTHPDAPWDTNFLNRASGPLKGIVTQMQIGSDQVTVPDFIDSTGQGSVFYDRIYNDKDDTNFFQCPYSPHRTIHQIVSWQANDPFVHYTVPDLTSTNGFQAQLNIVTIFPPKPAFTNMGALNFAYQPWGGYHVPNAGSLNKTPLDFDVRFKDPGLQKSDDWDFPTNRLPNIGWLGRIHRGTPWQTVFMKPSDPSMDDWRKWSNDNITNDVALPLGDAFLTHPSQDYGLFDLFTTSINDNAARGRLNINQTNLAAWSAILSGVSVITNSINGLITGPALINPAGPYDPSNASPVALMWQGINATRANTNATNNLIFLNQTFQHAGDVLATPQLSSASPFLNTNALNTPGAGGINDEMMERIPQQIMSLLTLNQTPRFVIYSFGQTLHPADHSLVVGGTFNGLCTNYQVTAESATRAVVRVEGTADSRFVNGKVDPQGRSYPPHIVVEQFNVLGPD